MTLKDRKEDGTFNRFDALEDLGQQEVNTSMLDLELGGLVVDQVSTRVNEN